MAKTIFHAMYLMEVLGAYASSLGPHVGLAFNAAFGKLSCVPFALLPSSTSSAERLLFRAKNQPKYLELEAREPPQVRANYLLALNDGRLFGTQAPAHGGYPAVGPSSLSGPVSSTLR